MKNYYETEVLEVAVYLLEEIARTGIARTIYPKEAMAIIYALNKPTQAAEKGE